MGNVNIKPTELCITLQCKTLDYNNNEWLDKYPIFLGVTILLSLTIFLNTVSSIIPITSNSPLIGGLQPEKESLSVCLGSERAKLNFDEKGCR